MSLIFVFVVYILGHRAQQNCLFAFRSLLLTLAELFFICFFFHSGCENVFWIECLFMLLFSFDTLQ